MKDVPRFNRGIQGNIKVAPGVIDQRFNTGEVALGPAIKQQGRQVLDKLEFPDVPWFNRRAVKVLIHKYKF